MPANMFTAVSCFHQCSNASFRNLTFIKKLITRISSVAVQRLPNVVLNLEVSVVLLPQCLLHCLNSISLFSFSSIDDCLL